MQTTPAAKSSRSGIWHITVDNGDDTRGTLLCGPARSVQHHHAGRATFEAMPKRARCPGCDAALAAYKARLAA